MKKTTTILLAATLLVGTATTAQAATPPATGVSAYYRADLGYMVGWTLPTNRTGITGYTVTSIPEGKTCTTVGSTSAKCVYPASALTYATPYTFTVTANGTNATSAPSNSIKSATIPVAPNNPTATTTSNTEITVAWVPNSDNGGATLYGYTVTYWQSDNSGQPINATKKQTVTAIPDVKLTNLTPSKLYIIDVASCNAYGCNSANNWAYRATTPTTTAITAIKIPISISGGSASTTCFNATLDAATNFTKSATACPNIVIDPATYPIVDPTATTINQPVLATKFQQTATFNGFSATYSMATWSATGGNTWSAYFKPQTKSVMLGFTTPITITSNTPTVCAISGEWIKFLNPGTCTVTGTAAGDNVFTQSNTATTSFIITR